MRKIFKAVFVITIFSVLTRIGGFVFRVFLSRTIGAEGMGLYQITMSVFGLLVTLTSSGIPLVVSKRTAEIHASKNSRGGSGTVSAALIIALIVSIIAVLLLFFGRDFVGKLFADKRNLEMLIVLLPAVVVSSFYSVFRGGLWGQKKFFTYGLLEFLEQYIRVGIGVVMLQGVLTLTQSTMRAAVSLSISYIAAALIAAIVYFATGERLSDPRPHFKPVLRSAAPITLLRIASSIIGSIVALIVPLRLMAYGLTRSEALSQFGSAAGMALPLLSIPITLVSSLALALVPELSSSLKNKAKLHSDVGGAIKISVVLGGLFVAFFLVAGQDFSHLIFKDSLADSIVRLGALSVIPSALCLISGSILNSLGLELKALKCYLVTTLILLAGTWILPSLIGINGMVIASLVTMIVSSVLNIYMIGKIVPVGGETLKITLLTLGIIVPVTVFSYLLRGLLLAVMPLAPAVLVIFALSTGLYILLGYTFNLIQIDKIVKIFRERKKRSSAGTTSTPQTSGE